MLSIAIIEDDPLTTQLLISTLREVNEQVSIAATLSSVQESICFFKSAPAVDLILSDVQLSDGLSFSIFEEVDIVAPIVFISSYDQYIVNAFEYSGIDYLLKPISRESLKQSIDKYISFQKHFMLKNSAVKNFLHDYLTKQKTRIIVKKGYSFISLMLTDIVLFYTENLIVYAIDNAGSKYTIDKNLNTLEEELDERIFFRANRQYIVNINYIHGYKSYERVKLFVSLKKELDHIIIVGQEKAKLFRRWLAEA